MKSRKIIIFSSVVLAIFGMLLYWHFHSLSSSKAQPQPTSTSSSSSLSLNQATRSPGDIIKGIYPQISTNNISAHDAIILYLKKSGQDHDYDWKVSLNFYGKVVDENNQPVQGADVHMDWTTIGVLNNYSKIDVFSDGSGLFSLTGQHGKILGVRVEKNGYYTVEGGMGTVNFEYANPSSPYWYEPDPNRPVIFHLRKKGEGAKLFSKSLQINLLTNPQRRVNLMEGFIKPDGVLTLTSNMSTPLPGNQPFPWKLTLSMAEGGLIETDEQFPFLAPENGYVSTVTIDMNNLDPKIWQDGFKKTYYFYLPSTKIYGCMTVDYSTSLPLGLDFSYNLTPGSRILEPAIQ